MITEYGERLIKEKMASFNTFSTGTGKATYKDGSGVELLDIDVTDMEISYEGGSFYGSGVTMVTLRGYAKEIVYTQKTKEEDVENGMRYDRFPANGGLPVAASVPGYSKIPWTDSRTTLIVIDGTYVGYAKTMEEKRNFAFQEGTILVCWPGRYSQDIFVVDDKDQFRKALGFKLASEIKRVDEKGRKWVIEK